MVYTVLLALLVAGAVRAQTLELRQVGAADTGAIEIAVIAELADTRASGISFYVAIPEDAFAVIGAERPFAQGPLLAPAVEFLNETMAGAIGAPEGMVLLPYAAVRGPGAERGRTGAGEVARFALRPLRSGPLAISLISTAIYEAKLVLDDGVGERLFAGLGRLEWHAGGREPGQSSPVDLSNAPAPGSLREKSAAGRWQSWAEIKVGVTAP